MVHRVGCFFSKERKARGHTMSGYTLLWLILLIVAALQIVLLVTVIYPL